MFRKLWNIIMKILGRGKKVDNTERDFEECCVPEIGNVTDLQMLPSVHKKKAKAKKKKKSSKSKKKIIH